jgi:hypothetical protein
MTGTVAVLDSSGDLSVPGDLSVTGDATISGDLTFGNQTSDTVTFVADVDSSIIPEVSGTYDLGSSTYPWNDIFADGNITAHGELITEGDWSTGTSSQLTYIDNLPASSWDAVTRDV